MRKTLCSGCGKYFSSTTEFDAHRTGQFGMDRCCMTTEEMLDKVFVAAAQVITDEIGRPTRQVWFRASHRAKVLESFIGKSAIGIVGGA